MAGTRTQNTMQEGLASLLGQISQLKLAPDANLEMLTNLETQVLQAARGPQDQLKALQAVQQQLSQPGSAGPMAAMPPGGTPSPGGMPMMAGMSAPGGAPPPGVPGAGMAGVSPGNPTLAGVRAMQGGISRITPGPGAVDELRRLLGK